MGGDIGFSIAKQVSMPGACGETDVVTGLVLPWSGMAKTGRYAGAVEGLWGPALSSCEIALVFDNTYSKVGKEQQHDYLRTMNNMH